jgi:PASTA domain-containing protein
MARASRHLLRSALVGLAALCALPATGQAAVSVFGSDLSSSANVIEAHGADSAFWNVNLAGGQPTRAPVEGQVTEIRVKGTVIPNPDPNAPKPLTMIHFQVLRPQPDGSVRVMLSSGDFYTPLGGDPQQVTTYRPTNLCVNQGDYVDFNDIGGSEWWWYPYPGMPYQVFSRRQGSATNFYTSDNGTNIGTQWHAQETKQNQELLMQTTLATGPDATDICPGGYTQHIFRGLEVTQPQTAMLKTRTNTINLRAFCHGENYGGCRGNLVLRGRLGDQDVDLGSVKFNVPPAYTHFLQIPIDPAATRLIQSLGSIRAESIADGHDNPREDSRVRWPSVPVQNKTTRATLTIKPDRPVSDCVVPNIKRKSISSAKKKLAAAHCKLGKVTRKKGGSSYRGRVITSKPKTGTVKPENTRVALVVGR